jgi:pimeloyl-ACP methyl ester carboxylesterase
LTETLYDTYYLLRTSYLKEGVMGWISQTKEILPGVAIAPRIVETQAGRVELDLTEGDGPVVLASHGGFGGVDQARLMLAWLDPKRYRLLSVSRPGYLGTPLSSGPSFEEQADLFAALLDTLGIEKAAVVTLSAGGPPGYQFALRHPSRVWALVAISSVSGRYTMPETAGPVTEALTMSPLGMRFLGMIARRKPAWLLREVLQDTGYYTKQQLRAHIKASLDSPQDLAFVRGLMGSMNPYTPRRPGFENEARLFGSLARMPVERIRCPSLIIHGTHDADVKFYDGVYAYEHIPGAQRIWIEEGSHLAFWLGAAAPGAQTAAREFLNRHGPRSIRATRERDG